MTTKIAHSQSNKIVDINRFEAGSRYVTGEHVEILLRLLDELRDTTQSRSIHACSTRMIDELGGGKCDATHPVHADEGRDCL